MEKNIVVRQNRNGLKIIAALLGALHMCLILCATSFPSIPSYNLVFDYQGQINNVITFETKDAAGNFSEVQEISLAMTTAPVEIARCILTTNASNQRIGISFLWDELTGDTNPSDRIRYTLNFGEDGSYLPQNSFAATLPVESKAYGRNITVAHGNNTKKIEICTLQVALLEEDVNTVAAGTYSGTIRVLITEGGI